MAAARREARGGPSDVAVSLFDQLPDLGTRRSWTTRTGARLKNFGMLGAGLLIAVLLAIHGSPPRADDAADDDDMHTIPTPRGANSSGDSSR